MWIKSAVHVDAVYVYTHIGMSVYSAGMYAYMYIGMYMDACMHMHLNALIQIPYSVQIQI